MNKRLKIFILASVLLNVLLGGAVAGHFLHRPFDDRAERVAAAIASPALKEEARKLFAEDVKARSEVRKTREAALALLTAPSFDKEAYAKEMRHIHQLHEMRAKRMSDGVAALAEQLSQSERGALAEILRIPPFPPKK